MDDVCHYKEASIEDTTTIALTQGITNELFYM